MIAIGVAAIWLTSTGFSDQYDDLVRKGYRWVTSDGPFACRSKEDLQRVSKAAVSLFIESFLVDGIK